MNAAMITVVSTTLLIHCGHCQQRVTFSALQDTPKTLHSLNVRSISNRQSQTCTEAEIRNVFREECGTEFTVDYEVICQQHCRDTILAYYAECNFWDDANALSQYYNNAGSSAEAPTFVKALFLMTFIVIAMLLL